jgi:hypothetical protein
MLLSTSTSTTSNAIMLDSNNPIDAAVYAPNSIVRIDSNADITSIAGWRIWIGSNANIIYDFGLRDVDFTGGASTGAEVLSWQEQ